MHKMAPLTKVLFTVFVSVWAMLLITPEALLLLVSCQTLLFFFSKVTATHYKALASLYIFAALLTVMQVVLDTGLAFSMVVGLRMAAMTGSFILLFATTRIQDLTAALVKQVRVPHEYAFMFTATLRFIPDFFAEIKAVQEAQACRGYSSQGKVTKRLVNYLAIVQPLVLRAITRSETMAMSLELRGFNKQSIGGYGTNIAIRSRDYVAFAILLAGTLAVVGLRIYS